MTESQHKCCHNTESSCYFCSKFVINWGKVGNYRQSVSDKTPINCDKSSKITCYCLLRHKFTFNYYICTQRMSWFIQIPNKVTCYQPKYNQLVASWAHSCREPDSLVWWYRFYLPVPAALALQSDDFSSRWWETVYSMDVAVTFIFVGQKCKSASKGENASRTETAVLQFFAKQTRWS